MKSKRVSKQRRPGQFVGAPGSASLKQMFADVKRRQRERIRKAGKHECVKKLAGTASRVAGRGNKILKRTVVIVRFYECKICGRDMMPNDQAHLPPESGGGAQKEQSK